MLAVELKFESKRVGAWETKADAIGRLMAAFVRNGNLRQEFSVKRRSGEWLAYGVAPAEDAFRKSSRNRFVQQGINGMSRANLSAPRIRFIGAVPETEPACWCAKPEAFILFLQLSCRQSLL